MHHNCPLGGRRRLIAIISAVFFSFKIFRPPKLSKPFLTRRVTFQETTNFKKKIMEVNSQNERKGGISWMMQSSWCARLAILISAAAFVFGFAMLVESTIPFRQHPLCVGSSILDEIVVLSIHWITLYVNTLQFDLIIFKINFKILKNN